MHFVLKLSKRFLKFYLQGVIMIGELWSLKDKLNAVSKVANLPNYLSTNLQSD